MELRDRMHRSFGFESLIGTGPAHQRLLEQVRLAAASTAPVLILGEPGTGKRLVARAIHQAGKPPDQALVTVDCEALPAEVLEREIFVTSLPSGPTDESQPVRPGVLPASPRAGGRSQPGDRRDPGLAPRSPGQARRCRSTGGFA